MIIARVPKENMLEDMSDDKERARLKATIDENLKKVYQETLDEEIPDKFRELLARLRQKDAGK